MTGFLRGILLDLQEKRPVFGLGDWLLANSPAEFISTIPRDLFVVCV